jgi:hypothetical protein
LDNSLRGKEGEFCGADEKRASPELTGEAKRRSEKVAL